MPRGSAGAWRRCVAVSWIWLEGRAGGERRPESQSGYLSSMTVKDGKGAAVGERNCRAGQNERRQEREKKGPTEQITGVRVVVRHGLLLHVYARPQPLRVLVVGQRHGVRLALEVVEPGQHRPRYARGPPRSRRLLSVLARRRRVARRRRGGCSLSGGCCCREGS